MEQTKYRKDFEYYIDMPGLSSDCIGCVEIDDKYALIQVHPDNSLVVTPPVSKSLPRFTDLVFYANCLSYDHDLPSFISPVHPKALRKPIEKGHSKYINQSYYDNIGMAFEAIKAIRLGPLAYVNFRWPGFKKNIKINYTEKYSKVSQEVSLYATALKQIDPLSEFLNFYRVIERVSGGNGKDWILANISKLNNYDFGFLSFGVDGFSKRPKRKTNLFSMYRKHALSRIVNLRSRLVDQCIAKYFYNEMRCGIAHSKINVKDYDFNLNIMEVAKDNFVLRLLARIALEEQV
jgi:hypothetical protein